MKLTNTGNKVIGYDDKVILPGDTVEISDKECAENGTIAMFIERGILIKGGAANPVKAPDNKGGNGKDKV